MELPEKDEWPFQQKRIIALRPILQGRILDLYPVVESRSYPDQNVEERLEIVAVHMYGRMTVKEVNRHEWRGTRTMFRRLALDVHTYSEIEVVQNGIYIAAFLSEHQVVETDIPMKNLRDFI